MRRLLPFPFLKDSKSLFLLFFSLIGIPTLVLLKSNPAYAIQFPTHTLTEDFEGGTYTSDVQISDGVSLKNRKTIHDTAEDFQEGTFTPTSSLTHSKISGNSLSVGLLNEGYCYDFVISGIPAVNEDLGWIIMARNLSGSSEIRILDTMLTPNPLDDEMTLIYTIASNVSNEVRWVRFNEIEDAILVETYYQGIFVIYTNGTIDNADDEVINYSTTTSPALPVYAPPDHAGVATSFVNGYLDTVYVGMVDQGAMAIDMAGTTDISDDVILGYYKTGAEVPINTNEVRGVEYDDITGHLYILGIDGFFIVDTNKTKVLTDDSILHSHSFYSYPHTQTNPLNSLILTESRDYIYFTEKIYDSELSRYIGFKLMKADTSTYVVSEVETFLSYRKSDPDDIHYDSESGNIYIYYWDSETNINNILIFSTVTDEVIESNTEADYFIPTSLPSPEQGLHMYSLKLLNNSVYTRANNNSVIYCGSYLGNNLYFSSSQYQSDSLQISSDAIGVNLDIELTEDQEVQTEIRTGTLGFYEENFDDGETTNVGDLYSWGDTFNTIVESDGIVKLSDIVTTGWYAYAWVGGNEEDIPFIPGSEVIARLRVHTAGSIELAMFFNDWGDDEIYVNITSDEWITLNLTATEEFSDIGFELYGDSLFFDEGDYLEIDYITIGNYVWGAWSTPCTTGSTGCSFSDTSGDNVLQYRLTLESSPDLTSSPIIDTVTLDLGYPYTSTYISPVVDAGKVVDWNELAVVEQKPESTSIGYRTRTGNTSTPDESWSEWESVNSPISSPDSRYIQYEAVLGTSDSTVTPTIESVSLTYVIDEEDPPTPPVDDDDDETPYVPPSDDEGDDIEEENEEPVDEYEDEDDSVVPGDDQTPNDDDENPEEGEEKGDSIFTKVVNSIKEVVRTTLDTLSNSDINTPVTKVVVVGSFTTVLISYLVNIFSAGKDTSLYTLQLISSLVAFGKLRKKTQNYGIVYDSVTKEPLTQAVVRVSDLSGKLVTTVVTDVYGIFDINLESGDYKFTVEGSGYTFPSKTIQTGEDLPYQNVYLGGVFNHSSSEPVNISIPMDRIDSRFVEESGASVKNILKTVWNILVSILFVFGLITTIFALLNNPTPLAWIIFGIYLLFVLIYTVTKLRNTKKYGYVSNSQGVLLSGLEIGLMEQEFGKLYAKRVTDEEGKYRFIVPGGKYKLVVLNPQFEITDLNNDMFEVKDGSVLVVNEDINVRKV